MTKTICNYSIIVFVVLNFKVHFFLLPHMDKTIVDYNYTLFSFKNNVMQHKIKQQHKQQHLYIAIQKQQFYFCLFGF